jgi:hypothetical protein
MDKKLALRYFNELTTRLKLYQGVPKVVSGIGQNTEVIGRVSNRGKCANIDLEIALN